MDRPAVHRHFFRQHETWAECRIDAQIPDIPGHTDGEAHPAFVAVHFRSKIRILLAVSVPAVKINLYRGNRVSLPFLLFLFRPELLFRERLFLDPRILCLNLLRHNHIHAEHRPERRERDTPAGHLRLERFFGRSSSLEVLIRDSEMILQKCFGDLRLAFRILRKIHGQGPHKQVLCRHRACLFPLVVDGTHRAVPVYENIRKRHVRIRSRVRIICPGRLRIGPYESVKARKVPRKKLPVEQLLERNAFRPVKTHLTVRLFSAGADGKRRPAETRLQLFKGRHEMLYMFLRFRNESLLHNTDLPVLFPEFRENPILLCAVIRKSRVRHRKSRPDHRLEGI